MGGCSFEDNHEFVSPKTLVLVGKTGNGKSATANSILGMKVFKSKRSSSGVTITSELHATELEDGQMLNVIDTPGLFDSSLDFKFISKEIVNCINMAKDGIHAFLVVVSIHNRFSEDEKAAVSSLMSLFGPKIYDYMIVVFTGGDLLDEEDETLEDFLCNSPEALKETLCLCENRFVLFDNKTKDDSQRSDQVNELLSLVNAVSRKNDGKPYTNEFFAEFKNQTKETEEQELSIDDEKFKRIFEMVESKLKETTLKLEQQLAEERAAWDKAQKEANEEKRNMKEQLKEAKKREEEKQKEADHWRQREWATWAKAENEANAVQKKLDEEKRKMKEQLEEAKKREEKQQKEADHWRQREMVAWVKAEKDANAAQRKSDEAIRKMKQQLEEGKKREEEWRQREEKLRSESRCVIM